jgi:hypothetical protein
VFSEQRGQFASWRRDLKLPSFVRQQSVLIEEHDDGAIGDGGLLVRVTTDGHFPSEVARELFED